MDYFDYSIIIPHKDSVSTLYRLLSSIPDKKRIEIIVIDNSEDKLDMTFFRTKECSFKVLYSPPENYAGGARNVGIQEAKGKWLIFADSDDFFECDAFSIMDEYLNSTYDLIYFGCNSVYDDTLLPSDRHFMFQGLVDNYLSGKENEMKTRLYHVVPWAKMIKRSLVYEYNIRFDEVIAANDVYFSTQAAFYAKSFHADTRSIYVVTTRKGSLAHRWNYNILKSRFLVNLRRNQFLRMHGFSKYQVSVMIYLYKALKMNISTFIEFLILSIKFRQNIFVGALNWFKTFRSLIQSNKNKKEYIVNEK